MSEEFTKLVSVIEKLRDPVSGCPWDIKQTHDSLKKYLIEEAYEVIDAIDNKSNLSEELGDLLLQVLLHSQIAKDHKQFDITQVIEQLTEKLIIRHPHVFGELQVTDADEVVKNWNAIKEKGEPSKLLNSLPALIKLKKVNSLTQKSDLDFGEDEIGKLCKILYRSISNGNDLEVEISKRISDVYNNFISKS